MGDERRERYRQALEAETQRVDDGLAAIRAREMSGELGVRQAANERITLIGGHLYRLNELRRIYLEGESGA